MSEEIKNLWDFLQSLKEDIKQAEQEVRNIADLLSVKLEK